MKYSFLILFDLRIFNTVNSFALHDWGDGGRATEQETERDRENGNKILLDISLDIKRHYAHSCPFFLLVLPFFIFFPFLQQKCDHGNSLSSLTQVGIRCLGVTLELIHVVIYQLLYTRAPNDTY